MGKLMFQFREPKGTPCLDEVCRRFHFRADEVDPNFGVVAVDPDDHLFVVLVDEAARQRVTQDDSKSGGTRSTGFFSNPKIEPFGPPKG